MTTAVIVDAHAGWDVEVTVETVKPTPAGLERMGPAVWISNKEIVKAGEKKTFYIHGTCRLGKIVEVTK